jgi:hypothetical protein
MATTPTATATVPRDALKSAAPSAPPECNDGRLARSPGASTRTASRTSPTCEPRAPPASVWDEYSNITHYEGPRLLIPATIKMQSPAYEQAAAACSSLAENFDHSHN